MNQGIRHAVLLLLITFGFSVSAQAAALKELRPVRFYQEQHSVRHQAHVSRTVAPTHTPGTFGPRIHKNPDDLYNSTVEGRIAFISSLFSVVSLVAFSLSSFSFFIVPVIVFGIIAIVFGAVGIRRRKRGFAVAGLALGMLGLIAGFAVLATL